MPRSDKTDYRCWSCWDPIVRYHDLNKPTHQLWLGTNPPDDEDEVRSLFHPRSRPHIKEIHHNEGPSGTYCIVSFTSNDEASTGLEHLNWANAKFSLFQNPKKKQSKRRK